jgi:hypothetical protein
MEDKLRVTGVLRITALRINRLLSPEELALAILRGLAFPVVKSDNLVVNVGLDALAALLGGGRGSPTVGGTGIDEATVRDLGAVQMLVTDQVAPTAPAAGDTVLEGSTEWDFHVQGGVGDSLLTVTYPSTGQVRFSGLVPKVEKDGVTFTEEGLFSNNGKLIARTTFSKLKTTAFALQFDHTISFTAP